MLKKAQPLVMVTVLILSAAFVFSFGGGPVQGFSYPAACGAKVARQGSLTMLAESTAPSQTENSTSKVTSSGAVEASFTVITRAGSEPAGAWAAPTSVDEGLSGGTPTVVRAQDANGVAGGQAMGDGPSTAAAGVSARSGGLTRGWAVLTSAWAVAGVALMVLTIWYGRAGRRSHGHDESGGHSA